MRWRTVQRREQREVRYTQSLMAAATALGVLGALAGDVRLRAAACLAALAVAWLVYVLLTRRRRQLTFEAVTDPLTGLYNRRYLGERLREEAERARRSGRVFTVALVDIDDFKHFNDRYGHQRGDQMLVAAAKGLRTRLRASDAAFRYGGEEFLVIFPDAATAVAGEALSRVFEGVHEVTFSGGLAEYPEEGSDEAELIALADLRLRQAKRAGKARLHSSL